MGEKSSTSGIRRSGEYWARFKGPIGDAIGPMLCETFWYEESAMAEKPLRNDISPTHYGDFNDNPAFEGPSDGVVNPWAENPVVYGWVDRWYDPLLRLVMCRLLRNHRWVYCSSYVQRVPDAQPGVGRQVWWRRQDWRQCRLCGEQESVAEGWTNDVR